MRRDGDTGVIVSEVRGRRDRERANEEHRAQNQHGRRRALEDDEPVPEGEYASA